MSNSMETRNNIAGASGEGVSRSRIHIMRRTQNLPLLVQNMPGEPSSATRSTTNILNNDDDSKNDSKQVSWACCRTHDGQSDSRNAFVVIDG
jgi:hypothetical protein